MANTLPILIVGAGTTGLAMACELARHGAPVRIIDRQSGINPHCRACSAHARTLEIFHDLGIVEEILAQGHKVLGMSQYANDVLMESTLARDEIHTFMGDRGLLFFFPLTNRRWLIAADLPTQHDAVKEQPSLEDVRAIASERGPTVSASATRAGTS
jgi:glycine/D-amino acid oxidase-like deaminating enzyme